MNFDFTEEQKLFAESVRGFAQAHLAKDALKRAHEPQFPFETYGRKWQERKGKAIHTVSDFGRPLYEWGEALFRNAVRI
jgi:alkylation response protein AidB-like acyl-CoA dehydrogenase